MSPKILINPFQPLQTLPDVFHLKPAMPALRAPSRNKLLLTKTQHLRFLEGSTDDPNVGASGSRASGELVGWGD